MRRVLVVLHRWFGLFVAVFLFVAATTGAVMAWDHEIDAWLSPAFYRSPASTEGAGAEHLLTLADKVEANDSRIAVRYMPLATRPGEAWMVQVAPRSSADGEIPEIGFDQMALDPRDGHVQAKRQWGAFNFAPESVVPFLYKLHYSLHIPDGFGIPLGGLFMGIIAVVWTLDCFVALVLAFPNRRAWRKSFAFRFGQGSYKLNFDLHRSGGVWLWGALLVCAFTAVSMNLGPQLVRPLVASVTELSPSPFEATSPLAPGQRVSLTRRDALRRARAEARLRNVDQPPGGLYFDRALGLYGVGFFAPGDEHGSWGLGNTWIYIDGRDGSLASIDAPGEGSVGDIFMQAQFPLHSGRILGVGGRIFVTFLGIAIAMLSVTGVIIWMRKRYARAFRAQKATQARSASPLEDLVTAPDPSVAPSALAGGAETKQSIR